MSASFAERWVRFVALGVGMIFVAFPFYWMLLTAFTPRDALFRPPFALVRLDFSLGNFAAVSAQGDVNLALMLCLGAASAVVSSLAADYDPEEVAIRSARVLRIHLEMHKAEHDPETPTN